MVLRTSGQLILFFYQKGCKPYGNYMLKQVNSLSLLQISHYFLFSHTFKFRLRVEVMFQCFHTLSSIESVLLWETDELRLTKKTVH